MTRRAELTVAVLAVALGLVVAAAPVATAVLTAAALAGLALWRCPRWWLPSIALALFALVPVKWLPVPGLLATLSPALGVIAMWALRLVIHPGEPSPRGGHGAPGVAVLATFLAGWLLLAAAVARYPWAAIGWTISFVGLALAPPVIGGGRRGAGRAVVTTWLALAAALGAFAGIETFLLADNPLLGWAYRSAPPPDAFDQWWGVYRATTTLGHPLLNATFFAVAVPLALAACLRRLDAPRVAALALALVGLIASGARGALLAMAAGAVVTAVLHRRGRGLRAATLLPLVAVAAIAGAGAVVVLSNRAADAEAQTSLSYRLGVLQPALEMAAENPLLGIGPGTAGVAKSAAGGDLAELSYENSWVELLVGAGVPAALLLIGVCGAGILAAARRRNDGVAGALVTYVLVAGSFNLLDGHRPAHILLGALLLAVTAAPLPSRPRPAPRPAVLPIASALETS